MSAVVSPDMLPRQRARPGEATLAALLRCLRACDPRRALESTRDEAAVDAAYATALASAPQAVPRLLEPHNSRLRHILLGSLILHAAVILLLLWHNSRTPAPPHEISVELVQQMPTTTKPVPPTSKPTPQQRPSQQRQNQQHQDHRKAQSAAHRRPPPQRAIRMPDKAGPNAALALPGASAAGGDAVAYPQLVLSQVAKAKKEGRYIGIPGAASVAFRLGDDGNLVSVELVHASGDSSLDEEAVAMIKRGAPYPPPPPGGRRDYAITLLFTPRPKGCDGSAVAAVTPRRGRPSPHTPEPSGSPRPLPAPDPRGR